MANGPDVQAPPGSTDLPPPNRPFEWARAWAALGRLIEDPQRTDQVFEIISALAGNSFERQWQQFRSHPVGQRLLASRSSLLAALQDVAALEAMPDDSFGRAYARFMAAGGLRAGALVEAEAEAEARHPKPGPLDPDREFFGDRMRDMHDLWHVLTGYGMDEAGEAANLAFTLGQVPTPGIALIVLAAGVLGPFDWTFSWQRYLFTAWRRGMRTPFLGTAPFEELLPLPLDEVRRRLGLEPPEVAHPDGVIVANRLDEGATMVVRQPWEQPASRAA